MKFKNLNIPIFKLTLVVAAVFAMAVAFPQMSSAVTSKIVSNSSLAGWWTFDEGSGTVAHDFSGNGFAGVFSGSPAWSSGKRGKALSLDGSSAYVSVPDADALSPATITLSLWIKWDGVRYTAASSNDWAAPVSKGGFSSGEYTILVHRDSAGTDTNTNFYINGSNQVTWANSVIDTKWHLLSATYDGSSAKIYFDGTLMATANVSPSIPNTANQLFIGAESGLHPYSWGGLLDDARIYGRALSASEISRLYQAGSVTKKTTSQNGLAGLWSFDEGTSTIAHDFSGGGNNGTMNTFANPATASSGWTTGKRGNALAFDGSSDYITAGSASSYSFVQNTGVFSASAWIKLASLSGLQTVFGNSSTRGIKGFILYYSGNQMQAQAYNGDGVSYVFVGGSGANTITDTNWHHVAWTGDGSTLRFYIDGALKNTTSISNLSSGDSGRTLGIGSDNMATPANFFNGMMDDARIYSRTLSAAEVSALYKQGAVTAALSPSAKLTSGLVGYWTFDGKNMNWTTNTAIDSSGGGNGGTLSLMSMSASPVQGKIGQALTFNGTNQRLTFPNLPVSGTSDLSMSAWVKTSVSGTRKGILVIGNQTGNQGIMIFVNSSDQAEADVSGVVGPHSTVTVTDGKWHLISMTKTGSTLQMYVDGVASGSTSAASPNLTSAGTNWIGEDFGLAFFNGAIDEVRIYNRALSAAEVKQLYNQGK